MLHRSRRMLNEFLQSAYETRASFAKWDRAALERRPVAPLGGHERVRRNRFPILLDGQHPPGRCGGAVGALQSRADRAGGADRSCWRADEVEAVGISDAERMLDVAAKADGERASSRRSGRIGRSTSGEGEEALAVGRLDQLAASSDRGSGRRRADASAGRCRRSARRERSRRRSASRCFPAASTRSMKNGTPWRRSRRAWSAGARPARHWRRTARTAGRYRSDAPRRLRGTGHTA